MNAIDRGCFRDSLVRCRCHSFQKSYPGSSVTDEPPVGEWLNIASALFDEAARGAAPRAGQGIAVARRGRYPRPSSTSFLRSVQAG
ncbi:Hypothetical protein GbCGDNIH6_8227 [Granulibacter bethesdensis]|nr:Hypothetical protein GbCGDNIH6_8227 [Granulibacter bethesdensis]